MQSIDELSKIFVLSQNNAFLGARPTKDLRVRGSAHGLHDVHYVILVSTQGSDEIGITALVCEKLHERSSPTDTTSSFAM